MQDVLERKVVQLEQQGPINAADVDFSINNPERLKDELGHYFTWSQGVEIEVPLQTRLIRTLLPNMSETTDRFVTIWDAQETQHGRLLLQPMITAGIDTMPNRDRVSPKMKLVGLLSKLSPGMHDVSEFMYYIEGALAEKETHNFYLHFADRLSAIGEIGLAKTLARPIGDQEAAHLGFYRAAAGDKIQQMGSWQLRFARQFIERTYNPVGVRAGLQEYNRKKLAGHVILDMSGNGVEQLTDPVETLARDLLVATEDSMPPFLAKRYRECVEEYGQAA